jgi:hypothetical protein
MGRAARVAAPLRLSQSQEGREFSKEEADMAKSDFDELADAYEFGSTYPVVTTPAAGQSGGTSTSSPSNLQQLVTHAIQGVLGRNFKQGDYRSFKAALEVSFEYKEVGGRPTYEWKPRAYPAIGATDIGGGISGAQYSLVSFASSLHEKATPLIDGLHSLVPDVDEENFEAARSIFTTAWDEFVGELSREGAPRTARANALSESIFKVEINDGGANLGEGTATGHLIRLGALLGVVAAELNEDGDYEVNVVNGRFAFTREFVVTSDEEGYLTNFIALTDYFFAVANSWQFYFDTFFKEKKDLGGRLLEIERQLAVIEDGVNEVFVAMDSVNVDQSERLVIMINFNDDDDMSVEDFLSWVASFASNEAPQLISEGGKWGVQALVPTTTKLHNLTAQFIGKLTRTRGTDTRRTKSGLPKQFSHARVLDPLHELERYLGALLETAKSDF